MKDSQINKDDPDSVPFKVSFNNIILNSLSLEWSKRYMARGDIFRLGDWIDFYFNLQFKSQSESFCHNLWELVWNIFYTWRDKDCLKDIRLRRQHKSSPTVFCSSCFATLQQKSPYLTRNKGQTGLKLQLDFHHQYLQSWLCKPPHCRITELSMWWIDSSQYPSTCSTKMVLRLNGFPSLSSCCGSCHWETKYYFIST